MPTFDFTSPDGKTYSVDGPDGATPEQAFGILQQHLGAPPAVSAGEDIAKGTAAGFGNAAIGTLGMLGDVRDLASRGVDALGNKLGVDLSPLKKAAAYTALGQMTNLAPNSQDIKSTVSDPIVSPDYQPQTFAGKVAKTGAEFLPSLAGGEEGLATKLLTRVAAPAVASETAGALTNDNPYAKVAGALIGGAGASKAANAFNEALAAKRAPNLFDQVKTNTSSAYDALTNRNVASPISQSTLDNLASDITTTLNKKGIRPSTADKIHAAVDEIRSPATAGAADVADLVAARQNVKSLLGSPDANKAGAFVALGKIENAIEKASPGTMQELRQADKSWAAVKATESLDKKIARAELRAAGADSGMNLGNKIRQKVADLLVSNDAKYLSAYTKAELEKIVRGTASQNLMRHVGNLLGGGGGLGMLAGGAAGYEAGGVPGAIAAGLAGRGFKIANNMSVARQAQKAADKILRSSPQGQKIPPLLLPAPKLNVALSALRPALISAAPLIR